MFYYTYQIFDLTSKKFYIGKRNSKVHPSKDLGVKYFSSSKDKEFIKSQKVNPKNFEYRILGVFNNSEDACKHEIELHETYNVGINKRFYNRAKQTSTGFDITDVCKTIVQENLNGVFIRAGNYKFFERIGFNRARVIFTCSGKLNSYRGFKFRYAEKEEVFNSNCSDDEFLGINIDSLGKKYNILVEQYDKNKNFISCKSVNEFIEEGFDRSGISSALVGKTTCYSGFYWKYKDENKNFKNTLNEFGTRHKIIIQEDFNGNIIFEGTYKSFESKGFSRIYIYKCCYKLKKDYKGFKFRFK